jgi:pimeloyl-ACP methyl ester carboxylesterase
MRIDPCGVEQRDQWASRFVRAIPALEEALGGEECFAAGLSQRADRTLVWRGRQLHVELFDEGGEGLTVVFHHGYGAYSALYAPFLVLLARRGVRVVAVDRPGHGLSEGRRGDCTVRELAEVTRRVIREVVGSRSHPVVVFGSSAGGMLTSCLMPYLDDVVSGFICHGVHNPGYARPLLGRAAGWVADALPALRFPFGLIPRRIRVGISSIEAVRAWFRPGVDELACLDPTLRSVLSMTLAYRPPRPPSTVRRPVLVLVGAADRMLNPAQVTRSVELLGVPELELRLLDGGHMLLHEHPTAVLDAVGSWLDALRGRSDAEGRR